MLTDKDIAKLSSILATKDDIDRLEKEINGLRESTQALTIAVDKLTKNVETLTHEYSAINVQIKRHEEWIKLVANKVGVKLEV